MLSPRFFQTLILILFSVFLFACEGEKQKPETIIRPVKSMVVGAAQQKTTRNFPAKIIASRDVLLSFRVTGKLEKLPIFEGMKVKQGQLIAQLDPKKFQDAVNEAEAKYILAKSQFNRASQLVKEGHISRADYDKQKSRYQVTEANLSAAKRDLSYTTLKAPFDAQIAKKFVENHQFVKAKQNIAYLQDLTVVDIEINVPENIMLMVKEGEGRNQKVVLEALPKESFPVKFKEYSSQADPETQTYRVLFTMRAPSHVNVLPGMTATLKIDMPDFKSGGGKFVTIPSSAVFVDSKNQPTVFRINMKTMKLEAVKVSVSRLANDQIRVLSGLNSGDRIVTAGVHFLKTGEQVRLLKKNK